MTRARNARTLTPAHLKASINAESQFGFLRDMVASVPDIQTSLDDEPLVACEAASSANIGIMKSSTRLRPARSAGPGRGSRGRTRKSIREIERSASTCDEDDGEDEDGDGDEDSSCDIPADERRDSDAAPVPPLPLVTAAAHVIDDDYDAV